MMYCPLCGIGMVFRSFERTEAGRVRYYICPLCHIGGIVHG